MLNSQTRTINKNVLLIKMCIFINSSEQTIVCLDAKRLWKPGQSFILALFLSCSAPCGTGQTTIDTGCNPALLRNYAAQPADRNHFKKYNPIKFPIFGRYFKHLKLPRGARRDNLFNRFFCIQLSNVWANKLNIHRHEFAIAVTLFCKIKGSTTKEACVSLLPATIRVFFRNFCNPTLV